MSSQQEPVPAASDGQPMPPGVADIVQSLQHTLFPGGADQIRQEAATIRELCHGKLDQADAERVLKAIRFLLAAAGDKSEQRIKVSIQMRVDAELTASELDGVYRFITGDAEGACGGGDGTRENPIIVNHTMTMQGVGAEYAYLARKYGTQGIDWECPLQRVATFGGRTVDILSIRLKDGSEREVHFDVTMFYGK